MPRQRKHEILNTVLSAAITDAGLSFGAVAGAVNAVGEENGLGLHYDASAVAHWLTGTVPRPEGVAAAVEAFARIRGRPDLAAPDLGWPHPPDTGPGDPWRGDPVAVLTVLGRGDMLDRRSAMATGLYSLAVLAVPVPLERITRRTGSARRGGSGDVERIRAMTRQMADADDLYGGGHARSAVAAYLVNEVAPLLRGTTGRARPDLFRAASQVTYLAGYMASDAGANGTGQSYYVQAVRLADEAGDVVMHASALRSLAVQAIELGHGAKGLALADHAASVSRGRCPMRTRAWITGMQAEANANTDSKWEALSTLRRAERDLERADSLPESEWTGNYRRESLEHQTGLTLAALGDYQRAEQHFAASVSSRRTVERRTRTLIGARLAHAQVRSGQPEQAAQTVLGLRADLPAVRSARVDRELSSVRRIWQPQRANPGIGQADALIAQALYS